MVAWRRTGLGSAGLSVPWQLQSCSFAPPQPLRAAAFAAATAQPHRTPPHPTLPTGVARGTCGRGPVVAGDCVCDSGRPARQPVAGAGPERGHPRLDQRDKPPGVCVCVWGPGGWAGAVLQGRATCRGREEGWPACMHMARTYTHTHMLACSSIPGPTCPGSFATYCTVHTHTRTPPPSFPLAPEAPPTHRDPTNSTQPIRSRPRLPSTRPAL